MYRLYIIDDDPIITKGLSINIPWEKHGISVEGTACNGIEALKLMELSSPDVIISDVKMPQMDGIELAYNIHNKYPKARIVLLSAHDEFSYVHDALSLRVVDYLLKPADNGTILETVLKIIADMENEHKMELSLREQLPVMRQMFLSRIAEGYYKDENLIRSQIEFLELPLISGSFISAIIKLDDLNFYGDGAIEHELLKFAVSNIIEELIEGDLRAITYNSGENSLGLIFCSPSIEKSSLSSFNPAVINFFGKVQEMVEVHIKTTITIGYGNSYEGFLGIHRSYIEACSAIKYSHITGNNHVYSPDDASMTFESSLVEYNVYIENLISKVQIFAIDEAFSIIDELSGEIKKQLSTSVEYLKMLFNEIMFVLMRDANRNYSERLEFKKINLFDYYKRINSSNTLDNMLQHLKKLVTVLCTIGSTNRVSSKSLLVSQAVKYIMDNFNDETLSLNKVARSINVSPIYLSLLFKKEKGENFIDFIFNTRMNKAIELIRLNDLKTYEVAEMVGYKNPNYFGMCFKRFTGYTPSQWKEQ